MEKCCFCGKEISVGINGHNAKPIEVEGVEYPICCSECNCWIVVPTRIAVWPITDEAIYLKQEIERIKKNWEISKSQQKRLYDKLKANQNKEKIELLGKVKGFITETGGTVGHDWRIDIFGVLDHIDNLINELKGE